MVREVDAIGSLKVALIAESVPSATPAPSIGVTAVTRGGVASCVNVTDVSAVQVVFPPVSVAHARMVKAAFWDISGVMNRYSNGKFPSVITFTPST